MQEGITLRRAGVILRHPTDLAQFGFVFTVDEVDRHIHREDSMSAAKKTLSDAAWAKRATWSVKPLDRKAR